MYVATVVALFAGLGTVDIVIDPYTLVWEYQDALIFYYGMQLYIEIPAPSTSAMSSTSLASALSTPAPSSASSASTT